MTTMAMGTSHPAFEDLGGGRYQAQVQFSMPGPWRVVVTVVSPSGAKKTVTLDYSVGW